MHIACRKLAARSARLAAVCLLAGTQRLQPSGQPARFWKDTPCPRARATAARACPTSLTAAQAHPTALAPSSATARPAPTMRACSVSTTACQVSCPCKLPAVEMHACLLHLAARLANVKFSHAAPTPPSRQLEAVLGQHVPPHADTAGEPVGCLRPWLAGAKPRRAAGPAPGRLLRVQGGRLVGLVPRCWCCRRPGSSSLQPDMLEPSPP